MEQRNDVVNLIGITYTKNDLYQDIKKETMNEVFAEKRSIGQKEFFEAGQTGIKASYCFVIDVLDYNGEMLLSHEGKQYNVYRTFEKGTDIELYVEGRVGNGN